MVCIVRPIIEKPFYIVYEVISDMSSEVKGKVPKIVALEVLEKNGVNDSNLDLPENALNLVNQIDKQGAHYLGKPRNNVIPRLQRT